MFQSITTIILTNIVVIALFVTVSTRTNPIRIFLNFLNHLKSEQLLRYHLLAALLILVINKLELHLEEMMDIGINFTPFFYQLEGNVIHVIQNHLEAPGLTATLTFFYVIVFTSLLVASLFVYDHLNDRRLLYTFLYAVILNYTIAIPFYLFFPVLETWVYHPQVKFLIPEVYPNFEQEYRTMSGLDNCFPSVHTSLSVTMAIIALRTKNKWFSGLVASCTVIIIFSIFYLGIHWFSDAVAGVILAVLSVHLASRLAERPIGIAKLQLNPSTFHEKQSPHLR